MDLPIPDELQFGFITAMFDRTAVRNTVKFAESLEFDSLWVGDHVAVHFPILDPLVQLGQAAAYSETLTLGTSVYLLPLRHPVPVAKQVATLDLLCEGRLIFGIGVGGEFANEYEACGVPLRERGARMTESLDLLKQLWSEGTVKSSGPHYPIPDTRLLPLPKQSGGPPVWCGGRSKGALERIGHLADGWISYVVTPEQYAAGLKTIAAAAEANGRQLDSFGTGHLLFFRIDDTYEDALDAATEHLSARYAMDFRKAAERYAALGTPSDVAAKIDAFRRSGIRHFVLDATGPFGERESQLERFTQEVRPLLS